MEIDPIAQESVERTMALDLGDKRIGIAISDSTKTVARPLKVIERGSRRADFEKIADLIDSNRVNLLIVGLPISLSGSEGSRAAWTRDYSRDLAEHVHVEVILWDESFSTADAKTSLRKQGKDPKRFRDRIDAVAAAFILQSYLDGQTISG